MNPGRAPRVLQAREEARPVTHRSVLPTLLCGALLCAALPGAASRATADDESGVALLLVRIAALEERVVRLEVARAEADEWRAPPARDEAPRPGEVRLRPRAIPRELLPRLRELAQARALCQDARGRFVVVEGGIQFQLDEVAHGSPLATLVGLRSGDRLLSLNDLPFSASEREQDNMWDRLRRERRWTLRLLREGQALAFSFYLEEE